MAAAQILVADDSDDDVMLLEEAFRSVGSEAKVFRAGDGQEALDACAPSQGRVFNLIVLDYYLPKRNGAEVMEQLSQWGVVPGTPVVVLSGQLPASEEERLRPNTVLVTEKPGDFDSLCALARRILTFVKA